MKRFSLAICTRLLLIFATLPAFNQRHYQPISLRLLKTNTFLMLMAIFVSVQLHAQTSGTTQQQNDYRKVVTERVNKFVAPMHLTDSTTYKEVVSIITNQYIKINAIHEESAATVTAIKAKELAKSESDSAIKIQENSKVTKLQQQHQIFINQLEKNLSASQVEQVKNGMTYNVLNVTYTGYQDMIPTLKAEEKEKIYNWLVEARELAMDAESSDKKHAVFGKYKGRINNYLSAQGYDSQKERADWEARIKVKKDAAKSSN